MIIIVGGRPFELQQELQKDYGVDQSYVVIRTTMKHRKVNIFKAVTIVIQMFVGPAAITGNRTVTSR